MAAPSALMSSSEEESRSTEEEELGDEALHRGAVEKHLGNTF